MRMFHINFLNLTVVLIMNSLQRLPNLDIINFISKYLNLTYNKLMKLTSLHRIFTSTLLIISSLFLIGVASANTIKIAYKELNYNIEFPIYPSKRALIQTNNGDIDGISARIEGIEKSYKNLIRIPIAICRMIITLYSTQDIKLTSLNDLAKYKVSFQKGNIAIAKLLKNVKTTKVTSNLQLFKMLSSKRVDIIVTGESTAQNYINKNNINLIQRLSYSLPEIPLYHYLHKKHQTLIPNITDKLIELEKKGIVEKIIRQHQFKAKNIKRPHKP